MTVELLNLLREEFGIMRSTITQLSLDLARVEERLEMSRDIKNEVVSIQSRMQVLSTGLAVLLGSDGTLGKLEEISDNVKENTRKVDSLVLSRATMAGYVAATAAIVGIVFKFFV